MSSAVIRAACDWSQAGKPMPEPCPERPWCHILCTDISYTCQSHLWAFTCSLARKSGGELTAFSLHLISHIPRMMVRESAFSAAKNHQYLVPITVKGHVFNICPNHWRTTWQRSATTKMNGVEEINWSSNGMSEAFNKWYRGLALSERHCRWNCNKVFPLILRTFYSTSSAP